MTDEEEQKFEEIKKILYSPQERTEFEERLKTIVQDSTFLERNKDYSPEELEKLQRLCGEISFIIGKKPHLRQGLISVCQVCHQVLHTDTPTQYKLCHEGKRQASYMRKVTTLCHFCEQCGEKIITLIGVKKPRIQNDNETEMNNQ